MSFVEQGSGLGEAGLKRLRHDLLNPLNVLLGMTTMLLQSDLTPVQRAQIQTCRSTADRMLDTLNRLDEYQRETSIEGPAQLADLCSIAAARIDKPFDRQAIVSAIQEFAPGPSPRILLVDDAPDIEVLVRAYIQDLGCELDVVADGERAVAQASMRQYDLVFMDIGLPGLDGATAAHAIRAADLARGARPTPVIALSAVGSTLPPADDEAGDDVVVLEDDETAPLVPGFLDHRREEVGRLRELLEQGEFGRIQAAGHQMKGTGKSYGFKAISRLGSEIEVAAHRNDAAAVTRLLEELGAYLSRVQVRRAEASRFLGS